MCLALCLPLAGCGGFAKDKTTFTGKDSAGNTVSTAAKRRGGGTAKMAASSVLFGVPGLIGYGFYHHSQKNKDKHIAALSAQLERHPACRAYTNSYEATVNCLNSYSSQTARPQPAKKRAK